MADLIDRNALGVGQCDPQKVGDRAYAAGWNGLLGIINAAPAVDAEAVVRCHKCEYHHWEQEPCHGKTVHICSKLDAEVTRDFYCAAGKRKEQG